MYRIDAIKVKYLKYLFYVNRNQQASGSSPLIGSIETPCMLGFIQLKFLRGCFRFCVNLQIKKVMSITNENVTPEAS
jgi:hypothetical protein